MTYTKTCVGKSKSNSQLVNKLHEEDLSAYPIDFITRLKTLRQKYAFYERSGHHAAKYAELQVRLKELNSMLDSYHDAESTSQSQCSSATSRPEHVRDPQPPSCPPSKRQRQLAT